MLIMTSNSAKMFRGPIRVGINHNLKPLKVLNPTPALVRYFYTSISQNFIIEDLCPPHYSRLSYGYGASAVQDNATMMGQRFTLGLAWARLLAE